MPVDLGDRVDWFRDDVKQRLDEIGGYLGKSLHWQTERTTIADERAEAHLMAIYGKLTAIYNLLWWVVLAAVLHSRMFSDILGWVERLPVLLKLNQ
jgi:hypothetical protein